MSRFLVYGAYGYTGGLIVAHAKHFGLGLVVSGRDAAQVARVAAEHGDLPQLPFALGNDADVDAAMTKARDELQVVAVLHCAGPFTHTFDSMARGCIRNRLHYLDITGEHNVFSSLALLDGEARRAGVMLLPGAAFDVVPSDCLAGYLKSKLPTASHLRLAINTLGSGLSHGTAMTALGPMLSPNASDTGTTIRRNGALFNVPMFSVARDIDSVETGKFRTMYAVPWGDIVTSYHSTAIPNVEVYMPMSRGVRWMSAAMSNVPLLRRIVTRTRVRDWILARVPKGGPNEEKRRNGVVHVWGEAYDRVSRQLVRAKIVMWEAYHFSANSVCHIATLVAAGQAPVGFQTPSSAYGFDLVTKIPDPVFHREQIKFQDLPATAPPSRL